jgi:hypothetical protein
VGRQKAVARRSARRPSRRRRAGKRTRRLRFVLPTRFSKKGILVIAKPGNLPYSGVMPGTLDSVKPEAPARLEARVLGACTR